MRRLALLALLCAAGSSSTQAQLNEGMVGIKAYQIRFGAQVIGQVVVVGCDNPAPPPGFAAGQEYWTWSPGAAWRGSFTLVSVESAPNFNYKDYRWTTFPHEHFDLSRTVPMPAIAPGAADQFYEVEVHDGSQWAPRGWMWLTSGPRRAQEWYGRDLTADLVGEGAAIRFTSVEPPAPGSADVFLLVH